MGWGDLKSLNYLNKQIKWPTRPDKPTKRLIWIVPRHLKPPRDPRSGDCAAELWWAGFCPLWWSELLRSVLFFRLYDDQDSFFRRLLWSEQSQSGWIRPKLKGSRRKNPAISWQVSWDRFSLSSSWSTQKNEPPDPVGLALAQRLKQEAFRHLWAFDKPLRPFKPGRNQGFVFYKALLEFNHLFKDIH